MAIHNSLFPQGLPTMSDALPPLNELMKEFNSGRVPRSHTWQVLITGLYAYHNSLDDMQSLYEQIIEQFGSIKELSDTINEQHDQIESWYGQVDDWQKQVSHHAQLTSQFCNDASQSALTASDSESNANLSKVEAAESMKQATLQADRAKSIVDGFNPADTLPDQPISICINYLAPMTEPVLFTRMLMPERSVFPVGVPGSSAFCQTPPEQDFFIAFYHKDVLAGKVIFLAGTTKGQFDWSTEVVYDANDTFWAESQPEPDATLSGLSIVLHGYRSAENG